MSQIKALALLSGGLDSTLAIKLVQEQGVFVHALHFVIIKGVPQEEEYPLIAGVVCRYSKREPAEVIIKVKDEGRVIVGEPLEDEILESFKILKGASHGVG